MTNIVIGIIFGFIGLMWMKMDFDCGKKNPSTWKEFFIYTWKNC